MTITKSATFNFNTTNATFQQHFQSFEKPQNLKFRLGLCCMFEEKDGSESKRAKIPEKLAT